MALQKSRPAVYLCLIWCDAECAHGTSCMMKSGHDNRHTGYDADLNVIHTWKVDGKVRRCILGPAE
jgi:hypothetical protein